MQVTFGFATDSKMLSSSSMSGGPQKLEKNLCLFRQQTLNSTKHTVLPRFSNTGLFSKASWICLEKTVEFYSKAAETTN